MRNFAPEFLAALERIAVIVTVVASVLSLLQGLGHTIR
jgi:hypothetical protein